MPRNTDKQHALNIQRFLDRLGSFREPYAETGRKFDKIFVDGQVRYFVARTNVKTAKAGDILGAKSKLAPNFKWYFGTLDNVDKWDWSGFHGRPINDESVVEVKRYGNYIQYGRKTD